MFITFASGHSGLRPWPDLRQLVFTDLRASLNSGDGERENLRKEKLLGSKILEARLLSHLSHRTRNLI